MTARKPLVMVEGRVAQIPNGDTVSAAISGAPYIDFDEVPGVLGQPRRLLWNAGDGTLDLGMNNGAVTQQIGLEIYYRVKASAGVTNGQCLMFTGSQGNSGVLLAAPVSGAVDPNYVLGIATEDIVQGDFGFVTWFGKVRGVQTNGANYGETWGDGTVLYASRGIIGGLTSVRPDVDAVLVAVVVNAHGSNGQLFVRVGIDGTRWTRISGKPTTQYSTVFSIVDWGAPVGGYYSISVPASTHALTNGARIVQVYELVGSDYDLVQINRIRIAASGDVYLRVPESPDGRFAGRVAIM